jgi:hypothetical protein
MAGKKDDLIDLVINENVSAIQILEDRLGISEDEVIELINELVDEGGLVGTLTDDGKRFFKSEVKLSAAPAIEREDAPPDFMRFNTKPGIITAIIGFIMVGAGVTVNSYAADPIEQNFAAILIFLGIFVAIVGLYCLAQRKTPA